MHHYELNFSAGYAAFSAFQHLGGDLQVEAHCRVAFSGFQGAFSGLQGAPGGRFGIGLLSQHICGRVPIFKISHTK